MGKPVRRLESEIEELNHSLLEMGALVASSVSRSARSLIEKSELLAHQVIRDEARIDQMEIHIDDLVGSMIALSQPVARDMRFATAAIKINTDLERMGDLAVGIVERSLSIMNLPALPTAARIPQLAQLVESMVLRSLEAFVKHDTDLAADVMRSDDQVDEVRNAIVQELVKTMQTDADSVPRALDLVIIARQFERIADHATYIAADVIYLVNGENVRHAQEPVGQTPWSARDPPVAL
jgi:phosphate transport system protein